MSRHRYRVLIIGAGVAGLTAAVALRRAGHDVLIFERAGRLQELGAGLTLWGNATATFEYLGIDDQVRKIAAPLAKVTLRTPDGGILTSTSVRAIAGDFGAPVLAVHRAELMEIFEGALPGDCFRFSHTLTRFGTQDDEVVAHFENGSTESGDVLIGADGIWSTVRAHLHGPSTPRYSGYTAWRSITPREPQRVFRTLESTETWGRGTRFGWVPMSEDRVYWFAVKAAPPGQPRHPAGHKVELQELFGHWHAPIPETLQAAAESRIMRHDIYDRPPSPRWGFGPVTLAGDAAHPMTPNLGQGAAMAIEDAAVLAQCLTSAETAEKALRSYESRRYPRTAMVTNASYRMGALAQLDSPNAIRLRNTLMRLIPDRLAAAQTRQITDWRP